MKKELIAAIFSQFENAVHDSLTIKAKDFANELTCHNVIEKNLHGEGSISKENVANNLAVRKILKERMVHPQNPPPAENEKKVAKRISGEGRKIDKQGKKK